VFLHLLQRPKTNAVFAANLALSIPSRRHPPEPPAGIGNKSYLAQIDAVGIEYLLER
jgi:hypothetical protein